tara:strand:+ start:2491 stop:2700 length:210 start_codon:yes stop_codon:yes gene_type:complete
MLIAEKILNKLKESREDNGEPSYILIDRDSFLELKEYLEIPLYNKLTKYLGYFLYTVEVPYKILKLGYD